VIAFAVCLWLLRAGTGALMQHFHDHPSHLLFLVMMALCMVHAVFNSGADGGLMVFVDTFMCAGLLALLLSHASIKQRRTLAYLLLAVFVLNAIIALSEIVTHRSLVPHTSLPLDDSTVPSDEWRATGLNDSSLAGAMIMQMGLFLVIAMRTRWTMPLLAIMLLALASFGGRAAMAVSFIALMVLLIGQIVRGVMERRLTRDMIMGFVGASVVAPALIWLILTTTLGERIVSHMLLNDSSAEERGLAWDILGLLDSQKILLGSSLQTVQDYIDWLHVMEIENPWLALFLVLGIVGSVYFLIGFVPFVVHLWRTGGLLGQVLILTELIVASTSNSIGRKSPELVVMVAAVYACSAYRTQSSPVVRRRPIFLPVYGRFHGSAN
jgi:hypothetical protein